MPTRRGDTLIDLKVKGRVGVSAQWESTLLIERIFSELVSRVPVDEVDLGVASRMARCRVNVQALGNVRTNRLVVCVDDNKDLPAEVPSPFTVKIRATVDKVLLVPEHQQSPSRDLRITCDYDTSLKILGCSLPMLAGRGLNCQAQQG